MTYEDGDPEYLVQDEEQALGSWHRSRPLCGQTVFTFDIHGLETDRRSQVQGDRKSQPQENYIGDERSQAKAVEQSWGGSGTPPLHFPTGAGPEEDPDQ
eukprot:4454067-Karenia_brevis.AAC.1